MRIAIISTYRHPSRLPLKEKSCMQPAAPDLIAGLCPDYAEIEIYNEKEITVPLDRHWDIVFFSYLHSFYEHTKVLSVIFRNAGMTTVAGGRHASYYWEDCTKYFNAVVIGDPEANVPRLIKDFENKCLQPVYNYKETAPEAIKPYRYDLVDFSNNIYRLPSIEASRGCPFFCDFCVLTGTEPYRMRTVSSVVRDISEHMCWNPNFLGYFKGSFAFLDNNLGGSPTYLRELCEALIPLKKRWGCSLTLNVLEDEGMIKLLYKAGCRYIYSGLESLHPASISSMNKSQNNLRKLKIVVKNALDTGIHLSFGLIVGSDGDTNEYLELIPHYLADLGIFFITYIGIVCPYPGTPFFKKLVQEGRMIPGTTIRDLDGYTVCHKPKWLDPSEVVEHYKKICSYVSSFSNISRHYLSIFWKSNLPKSKFVAFMTGKELYNVRRVLLNQKRTYIAGQDPIEPWDYEQMRNLGIAQQFIA